jgi:PKD repeat protein
VGPLTLALTFSPNSSTAPRLAEVVTFTATPTAGALIQSYEWNFGDANTAISTTNQIPHSFSAPGSYLVSVRAVPTGGGTGTTQLATVDVKP